MATNNTIRPLPRQSDTTMVKKTIAWTTLFWIIISILFFSITGIINAHAATPLLNESSLTLNGCTSSLNNSDCYEELLTSQYANGNVTKYIGNNLTVPWYSSSTSCLSSDLQSGGNCNIGTVNMTQYCMVTDELSVVALSVSMGRNQSRYTQVWNTIRNINSSAYGQLTGWKILVNHTSGTMKATDSRTNSNADTASDADARFIQSLFIASNNTYFTNTTEQALYWQLAMNMTRDLLQYDVTQTCYNSSIGTGPICYWPAAGSVVKSGGMNSGDYIYSGYFADIATAFLMACQYNTTYCAVAGNVTLSYLQAAAYNGSFRVPPGKSFKWQNYTGGNTTPYAVCTNTCSPDQWDSVDAPRAFSEGEYLYYAQLEGQVPPNLTQYINLWTQKYLRTSNTTVPIQYYSNGTNSAATLSSFQAQGLQSLALLSNESIYYIATLNSSLGHYSSSPKTWDYTACFGVYNEGFPMRSYGIGIGRSLYAFGQGTTGGGSSSSDPTYNISAHYDFEGNGNDDSGNSITLTVSSNDCYGNGPYMVNANYLGLGCGGGGYLHTAYNTANNSILKFGNNNFTIAGWWTPPSSGGTEYLCTLSTCGDRRIYFSSSSIQYWSGGSELASATISVSGPTHIAITRNTTGSGGLAIYVNGAIVATGTDNKNYVQGQIYLGGDPTESSYNYDGAIDDITLINGTAWSQNQVNTDYKVITLRVWDDRTRSYITGFNYNLSNTTNQGPSGNCNTSMCTVTYNTAQGGTLTFSNITGINQNFTLTDTYTPLKAEILNISNQINFRLQNAINGTNLQTFTVTSNNGTYTTSDTALYGNVTLYNLYGNLTINYTNISNSAYMNLTIQINNFNSTSNYTGNATQGYVLINLTNIYNNYVNGTFTLKNGQATNTSTMPILMPVNNGSNNIMMNASNYWNTNSTITGTSMTTINTNFTYAANAYITFRNNINNGEITVTNCTIGTKNYTNNNHYTYLDNGTSTLSCGNSYTYSAFTTSLTWNGTSPTNTTINVTPYQLSLIFYKKGSLQTTSGWVADQEKALNFTNVSLILVASNLTLGYVHVRYNMVNMTNWTQYYEFINDRTSVITQNLEVLQAADWYGYFEVIDYAGAPITDATVRADANWFGLSYPNWSYYTTIGQRLTDNTGKTFFFFDKRSEVLLTVTKDGYDTYQALFTIGDQDYSETTPFKILLKESTTTQNPNGRVYLQKTYTDSDLSMNGTVFAIYNTGVSILTDYASSQGQPATDITNTCNGFHQCHFTLQNGTDYIAGNNFRLAVYVDGTLNNNISITYKGPTVNVVPPSTFNGISQSILNPMLYIMLIILSAAVGYLFTSETATEGAFKWGAIGLAFISSSFGWLAMIIVAGYAFKLLRRVVTE